jgi:site-specific DNA recombinase
MARALKVRRVSRNHDDSTALAKQDAKLDAFADAMGHEIIGDAADADVSGKTDPFKRAELGPWLTVPSLIASYDVIIASHLDRLGRSTKYISALLDWAAEHGKTIITLEPQIDFSTPTGKLLAYIISWLAEQELAMITQRSADTQTYLKANGYLVGRNPFGYMIVPDGEHKTLAIDPAESETVRAMVDRYLAGSSLRDICDWLAGQGIMTRDGFAWQPITVSQILRNPIIAGRRVDGSGKTVLKVEPIIDRATWDKLQAKLDAKASRKGIAPGQTAMLTSVIMCAKCGRPMYRMAATNTRKSDGLKTKILYYRCNGINGKSECRNMVRLDWADAYVNSAMRHPSNGDRYMTETIVKAGHGYEDEISEVQRDLAEIDWTKPEAMQRAQSLQAELLRLTNLPSKPAEVITRESKITVLQHWMSLDDQGKRDYLMSAGITIPASKDGIGFDHTDARLVHATIAA